MSVDTVLGGQLGDEGKGRLVDILSSKYDIVARCNSGGNAGHKVVVGEKVYAFHMVPSGILNDNIVGIIGNGCVINLEDLYNEICNINIKLGNDISRRLLISDRAHIVIDLHKEVDAIRENLKFNEVNNKAIGTTKQGMGPVYSTKALRVGLRMCDLFLPMNILKDKINDLFEELIIYLTKANIPIPSIEKTCENIFKYIDFFKPMICDTVLYLNKAINKNRKILVEGAQACLLDIDFGVYPYCTATNCTVGAICVGLGVPPQNIGFVNYVIKAYCTRVGNGHFPTEQLNAIGKEMQEIGCEYGTTTGRRRRCGWLDIPMIKWALMVNGIKNAGICMTKLDVFDTFNEIKIGVRYWLIGSNGNKELMESFPASLEILKNVEVEYETFPGWLSSTKDCRHYDDLPINAKKYIERIEELLDINIIYIGVGADRNAIIYK